MIDIPVWTKEALKEGNLKKEYRILVKYGNTTSLIDNDHLVCESVKIDERLCSKDTIKFGLCEGSSIEFQYFDYSRGSIKGCDIEVQLRVYYTDTPSGYTTIPMGMYTVKEASKQASTGIYKAIGYNCIENDYLNANIEDVIKNSPTDTNYNSNLLSMFAIKYYALSKLIAADYTNITIPWENVNISSQTITSFTTAYYLSGSYYLKPFFRYLVIDAPTNEGLIELNLLIGNYMYKTRAVYMALHAAINNACSDNTWENLMATEFFQLRCGIGASCNTATAGYEFDNVTTIISDLAIDTPVVGTQIKVREKYSENKRNFLFGGDAYGNNFKYIVVSLPYRLDLVKTDGTRTVTIFDYTNNSNGNISLYDFSMRYYKVSGYEKTTVIDKTTIQPVTRRNIVSSYLELLCKFGQAHKSIKETIVPVSLETDELTPSSTLYPNNSLLPGGSVLSPNPSTYSKLWTQENTENKWRYLNVKYLGQDDQEYTIQETVDANGNVDYDCTDNWFLLNLKWNSTNVQTIVSNMVSIMQGIVWYPFELWCAGLPYVEVGDTIEISIGNETFKTYVLQRQLKGIQNLQDTFINGELDIF